MKLNVIKKSVIELLKEVKTINQEKKITNKEIYNLKLSVARKVFCIKIRLLYYGFIVGYLPKHVTNKICKINNKIVLKKNKKIICFLVYT